MESASSTNLLILQLQPLHVTSSGLGMKAILRMCLLALLYGLQPSLTRKFTPEAINRSTVVFTLDIVKFFMAGTVLLVQQFSSLEGGVMQSWGGTSKHG